MRTALAEGVNSTTDGGGDSAINGHTLNLGMMNQFCKRGSSVDSVWRLGQLTCCTSRGSLGVEHLPAGTGFRRQGVGLDTWIIDRQLKWKRSSER